MAEFPALPLWTDAYLGDTTHLTTIEHGAYLLLLMTAWRTADCRLPDDDRLLARYARCTAGQWKRLRPILQPFFVVENGHWRQGRLTDEAVAVRQKKEAAAANGRASALKRKGRHSTERNASEDGATNGAPTKNQLNHNHNHLPLDKSNGGADPEKVMFDTGVAMLTQQGKSEGQARALLGKWKRDYGCGQVIEMLGAAQRLAVIDIPSWAEGRWRGGASTRQPAVPL